MTCQFGYCTNVHAGADVAATRANLQQHALAVKQSVSPDAPMGIGLWLSAQAADKLRHGGSVAEFAAWLRDVGLVPFTLNGFPYGDFHRPAVKHAVYEPKWRHPARAKFTLDLIALQDALLPTGLEGSISTLPLQWGLPPPTREQWQISAANVRAIAERLARLEQERGRLLYVCLEPEPGCLLQRSEDVVRFFEEHLLALGDEARLRRYVRVCHDVCHAAVMFEDQADVLRRYRAAGIGVGKVQVSAAVILDLDALKPGERGAAFDQLRAFAEDRYLHQTMIRRSPDDAPAFFEDLPPALAAVTDPAAERGQWRVHFHVPIYLERFGLLGTSQADIHACLETVRRSPDITHFEAETYAWDVLPKELQQPRLADGIARELTWLRSHL